MFFCRRIETNMKSCRCDLREAISAAYRITLLYNYIMPKQTRLQKFMDILRKQQPNLAEQYNVATLEVFGSYVRHEQRKNSDFDILVTFSKPPSLFKFVRLENYLSDLLGVKVNLVMKDSLKPPIGKNILREAQPV